jgi:hypothetical protein
VRHASHAGWLPHRPIRLYLTACQHSASFFTAHWCDLGWVRSDMAAATSPLRPVPRPLSCARRSHTRALGHRLMAIDIRFPFPLFPFLHASLEEGRMEEQRSRNFHYPVHVMKPISVARRLFSLGTSMMMRDATLAAGLASLERASTRRWSTQACVWSPPSPTAPADITAPEVHRWWPRPLQAPSHAVVDSRPSVWGTEPDVHIAVALVMPGRLPPPTALPFIAIPCRGRWGGRF